METRTLLKVVCMVASFVLSVQNAFPQYNGLSVGKKPSSMTVEQVDYYGNSMVVYINYTNPGFAWCNIGEKTYVRSASGKRYPLLNSINMPINSEAEPRQMVLSDIGQYHRFALEFEKVPEGEPFDIIESESNPNAFNFYGVRIDTLIKAEILNPSEFIKGYPVKEQGLIIQDGNYLQYISFEGITVTIHVSAIRQYGKYYNVNLLIQNTSGRSVLFSLDNVYAEGYVIAADTIKKTIPLQVFTAYEYDKKVKNRQAWNNFFVALGEGMAAYNAGYSTSTTTYSGSAHTTGSATAYGRVGNTYGYANAYGSSYTTTYGRSTTTTYDGAAAYWAQQQANANYAAYASAQDQIREQLNDGYVKTNTIKSGVEYQGFFNIKYNKKVDRLKLQFRIDGEQFVFFL